MIPSPAASPSPSARAPHFGDSDGCSDYNDDLVADLMTDGEGDGGVRAPTGPGTAN